VIDREMSLNIPGRFMVRYDRDGLLAFAQSVGNFIFSGDKLHGALDFLM
jgi:hypothetical protein